MRGPLSVYLFLDRLLPQGRGRDSGIPGEIGKFILQVEPWSRTAPIRAGVVTSTKPRKWKSGRSDPKEMQSFLRAKKTQQAVEQALQSPTTSSLTSTTTRTTTTSLPGTYLGKSSSTCLKCLKGDKSHHRHEPTTDNCVLFGVDNPTPAKARQKLLEQEIAMAKDEALSRAAVKPCVPPPPPPPPTGQAESQKEPCRTRSTTRTTTSSTNYSDEDLDDPMVDPLQALFGMPNRPESALPKASSSRTPIRAMASPQAAFIPPSPTNPGGDSSAATSSSMLSTGTSRPEGAPVREACAPTCPMTAATSPPSAVTGIFCGTAGRCRPCLPATDSTLCGPE